MPQPQTRRRFLQTSLAASAAYGVPLVLTSRARGANERLNIGVIGVGGRGGSDLAAVSSENVVALCDVDVGRLNTAASKFLRPKPISITASYWSGQI